MAHLIVNSGYLYLYLSSWLSNNVIDCFSITWGNIENKRTTLFHFLFSSNNYPQRMKLHALWITLFKRFEIFFERFNLHCTIPNFTTKSPSLFNDRGLNVIVAILLGHLKKPIAEVKQALYRMDESILTPDLLRQMIAYTPDSAEVSYMGFLMWFLNDIGPFCGLLMSCFEHLVTLMKVFKARVDP